MDKVKSTDWYGVSTNQSERSSSKQMSESGTDAEGKNSEEKVKELQITDYWSSDFLEGQ